MKKLIPVFVFTLFVLMMHNTSNAQGLYVRTVSDLNANASFTGGGMRYFSFKDSSVVTGSDTATNKWDIAFRGTTIWINGGAVRFGNGGAYFEFNTTFEGEVMAPETGWRVDESNSNLAIPSGSGNGWYSYDPSTHLISPIPSKILFVRTGDGKYAKVQILSYYEGGTPNPSMTNTGFYKFVYVYQPDGSRNLAHTSSVTNISTEIPEKFTLKQNFPNPFNPETTIQFSIPKAGNVSLKVYDAMGREVQGLINGNLSAGTYETNFNATGLSSGVYFYKLITNDFVQTKKMLLAK